MSSSLQPGMSSYCRFSLKNKKKNKTRLNLTENEEWSSAFLRKTIFYQKYFFYVLLDYYIDSLSSQTDEYFPQHENFIVHLWNSSFCQFYEK